MPLVGYGATAPGPPLKNIKKWLPKQDIAAFFDSSAMTVAPLK